MEVESDVASSSAPIFVRKLWDLVENPTVDYLISWSKGGTAFCVHHPAEFAKDVLPHYFKHNNFTSFVRQLNMYGFRKLLSKEQGAIKSENPEWEFHHQHFVQGKVDLLENIKRKVNPDEKKVKSEDVSNIIEDVKTLSAKHGAVQNQLHTLKMENEMLWQEMSELRMKHRKQQLVINKLVKFLILVYGRKGLKTQKRLAIKSSQAPMKRPRMASPHAQIEELESVKYLVESPKSTNSGMASFDDLISEGPQITVLPDEPSAKTFQPDQTLLKEEVLQQGSATSKVPAAESATTQILPHIEEDDGASQSIALPIVRANPTVQESTTSKTSSTTKKDLKISAPSASVKSKRPSSTKADKKASSKTTERSLKLQMPTMVSLNKEPVIDFSPSIFENIGQIFPADTNVSSLAVDDKLQELARSYDQSNAVVLKRGTSTEKDVIDHDVDHIDHSLDSLQSLLSGKFHDIDPGLLNQVFNPHEESFPEDLIPVGEAKVEDLQNTEDDEANDFAPFSPGMFLNEVGEPSDENIGELTSEENSLLSLASGHI